MGHEYDIASKIWATVFGLIVMLLIQWPALFTARRQHPIDHGNMSWNVVACLVGLIAPLAWSIDSGLRRRIPVGWIVVVVGVVVWLVVSIGLVNP